MFRYTSLCLLCLCCLVSGSAQDLRTKSEITTTDAKHLTSQPDEQQRQIVLYRVRSLVEKTLGLQDVRAKTIGVARIADLLWQHDEPYARQLFENALAFTDAKGESKDLKLLFYLRRNLIVLIAKRDRNWAKLLIESGSPDGSANSSGPILQEF